MRWRIVGREESELRLGRLLGGEGRKMRWGIGTMVVVAVGWGSSGARVMEQHLPGQLIRQAWWQPPASRSGLVSDGLSPRISYSRMLRIDSKHAICLLPLLPVLRGPAQCIRSPRVNVAVHPPSPVDAARSSLSTR
jgi:hypothetical protein